jgi:hypothetical protein
MAETWPLLGEKMEREYWPAMSPMSNKTNPWKLQIGLFYQPETPPRDGDHRRLHIEVTGQHFQKILWQLSKVLSKLARMPLKQIYT